MALPRRDAFRHTYADYFSWCDDKRYELIEGVAYIKEPPAPNRFHQELVGELFYQIKLALEGQRWHAYVAPFDVRLPKADEADDLVDTVLQPDVLIVRDRSKLDDRGMRGAPDWVAEVLSPTTSRHDQIVKIPVYERAGVLEVWLIHSSERTLTVYRLESGRYGRPIVLELRGRTAISALPGVSIEWDRVTAMLD